MVIKINRNDLWWKKALFEHPLIKFIFMLIIQFIAFRIINYFPMNMTIRLFILGINVIVTIYFIFLIVSVLKRAYDHLMSPKHLGSLIGAYALFVLAAVFTLSTLFFMVDIAHLGNIQYGGCSDTFDSSTIDANTHISRDYFYFASITFLSVGYGDICPMGFAKTLAVLTAFAGHLVSVILVALVINNYLQKKNGSK
jgi:potassium channel LctB